MQKYIDYVRSAAKIAKFKIAHRKSYQQERNEQVQQAVKQLHQTGIVVIPDFMPALLCAELRDAMDEVLKRDEKTAHVWQDELKADNRIFGFDRLNTIIAAFWDDQYIKEVRQAYLGAHDQHLTGFVMGNKVIYKAGNLGSGGGWHRDTVHKMQLKAFVYLSDVANGNGQFEYLENTHHKSSILNTVLSNSIKFNQYRFTGAEIEEITKTHGYHHKKTTGKSGTLILADTSGIHRGSIIEKDVRYALTQYIFRTSRAGGDGIPEHIEKLLPTA